MALWDGKTWQYGESDRFVGHDGFAWRGNWWSHVVLFSSNDTQPGPGQTSELVWSGDGFAWNKALDLFATFDLSENDLLFNTAIDADENGLLAVATSVALAGGDMATFLATTSDGETWEAKDISAYMTPGATIVDVAVSGNTVLIATAPGGGGPASVLFDPTDLVITLDD